MSNPISADMFARAIIAAAVNLRVDPLEAAKADMRPVLIAAAYGIMGATDVRPSLAARPLGLDPSAVTRAQKANKVTFWKAAEAAEHAVRHHLKTRREAAWRPERQALAEGAPLSDRIVHTLEDGPISAISLASVLNVKELFVSQTLASLRQQGTIFSDPPPPQGARHSQWHLAEARAS